MLKLTWISLSTIATIVFTSSIGIMISHPSGVFANSSPSQLNQVVQAFRREKKHAIRRGGVCAVSPGTGVQAKFVVWSDRPLFLWDADQEVTIQAIQLFHPNEKEKILWEKPLDATNQSVIYDGAALQPGKTYGWALKLKNQVAPEKYYFQVMTAQERTQVAADLQQLTQRLQASGATAETIAIRQAQYFSEKGMLSDALQVLYMVRHPSAAITQALQQLVTSACEQ